MIRLRSQKLLAGTSALAMLAGIGLTSPALANQTFTGPGFFAPIDNNAPDDFILVQTTAVIDEDVNGRSIENTSTLINAGDAIAIDDSVLLGDIFSSGTVNGTAGDGIDIRNGSVVAGGVVNTGSIFATESGIELNNSTIVEGILNSGTIGGPSAVIGIYIDNGSVLVGGVTNNAGGVINGSNAGILLEDNSTIVDGIVNSGQISGGDGIELNVATATLVGGILNNATGTITGTSNAAILITNGIVQGGITNFGLIQGQSGANAIQIDGGTFAGSIVNNGANTISVTGATATAIRIAGGTFTGDVTNNGQVLANVTSGFGIVLAGATVFTGNISNNANALISASQTAVVVNNATFAGGNVVNDGSIVSVNADGINISATTSFTGDVINNGTIDNGLLPVGGTGIEVNAILHTGDVTNAGSINAANGGINIAGTSFTGDVTNTIDGSITAGSDGIDINVTTLLGDVTNDGMIEAATGIEIDSGATLDGNLTNNGTLTAGKGIDVESTATVTGNIVNAAKIDATTDGIEIDGIVQGSIINTGSIDPAIGIDINGQVVGGILNSGTITATSIAIDVSGATAGHTITQTAGLIQGPTALSMVNGQFDAFNAEGGVLDGDVTGDGDTFDMGGNGTFAYSSGTATGLAFFDIGFNGTSTGTFVLGSDTYRVDGAGVTVTAGTMTVWDPSSPLIYLDNDTTITLTGALNLDQLGNSAATTEFHLKRGAGDVITGADYGSIASTAAGNLGPNSLFAAYLDPVTFGQGSLVTAYVYDNVITNIGADNFTNSSNILTSSPFFTGTTTNDGANIDVTITRLDFADALDMFAETRNQHSLGTALDAIYDNAVISAQFQELFAALFGAATPAEAQFIMDEFMGAEYAQLQGSAVSLASMFNTLMTEQNDGLLNSLEGTQWKMGANGLRRYAQGPGTASDAPPPMRSRGGVALNRAPGSVQVFLRGTGQWDHNDGDPEAASFDQDTSGVIGGLDYVINPNAAIGVAGGVSNSDVDFDTPGDAADIDSWHLGVYGGYGFGRFYLDGSAAYGQHDVENTRTIAVMVPSAPLIAMSSYDTDTWSVQAEVGAIWRLGRANIQPSVNLAWIGADADGFTETGAGAFNLVVQGADTDSLASTLAVRGSGTWMMGQTPVVPDIKIGWRHEFEDDRRSFSANFFEDTSSSALFQIVSSEVPQDSLLVSSGVTVGVTRNINLFADVNGLYSTDHSATNVSGGASFTW